MRTTKLLWGVIPLIFIAAIIAAQWGGSGARQPAVLVRQIVIKGDPTKEGDVERAFQEITRIRKMLNEGSDFKELARLHSQADSAREGGSIGWIGKGILPKRLEDIAFVLEPGKYSEIIEEKGPEATLYRIIYVEQRRGM